MVPSSQHIGIDHCNCFAARKAARQISRFYDGYLQPSGLRITQFLLLATLSEQGTTSVNGLAERLDVERTAMGKMIGFLERDGYVRIQPSPTDGRSRFAELTSEGQALLKRATPSWLEAQRRFNELNGMTNVTALRRSFSKIKAVDAPGSPFD